MAFRKEFCLKERSFGLEMLPIAIKNFLKKIQFEINENNLAIANAMLGYLQKILVIYKDELFIYNQKNNEYKKQENKREKLSKELQILREVVEMNPNDAHFKEALEKKQKEYASISKKYHKVRFFLNNEIFIFDKHHCENIL